MRKDFEMRFFGYAQNDRGGVAELLPDSSSQAPLNDGADGFERHSKGKQIRTVEDDELPVP